MRCRCVFRSRGRADFRRKESFTSKSLLGPLVAPMIAGSARGATEPSFHRQFTRGSQTGSMFRVLGCVFLQHDLRLVLLAGLLCLFACVTAMSMLERARAAEGNLRTVW